MSDFFSSGWSVFITIATLVSLAACLVLLVFASRRTCSSTGPRMQKRSTISSGTKSACVFPARPCSL